MKDKELYALARGANILANSVCSRQVNNFKKWKDSCFVFGLCESRRTEKEINIESNVPAGSEDLRPDLSQFAKKNQTKHDQSKQTSSIASKREFSSLALSQNMRLLGQIDSAGSIIRRYESNESSVPSSRISRLANYGQLAAGLALGSVGEFTSRLLDPNAKNLDPRTFVLTQDNIERIVATLCKIRGAAMKLGQMLSIQDDSLISKDVQAIFERVRQSADFMPSKQREKQIVDSLGENWMDHLSEFNPKPIAAASIGQVHEGILKKNGQKIAMKIQYPGVAESIDSDIDLLMAVLNYTNIIPRGLYLEEALNVAKKELAWECDYKREAAASKKFKKAFAANEDVCVPEVIPELTSTRVLTTEFVEGVTVDKCIDMDQETRSKVAKTMLQLCLTELFELRFMQTDPNFANFLYNPETEKLCLIDFGASRTFDLEWVRNYIEVIKCAIDNDKQGIIDYSNKLGFLSGYETPEFADAHCEAVLVLGEAFRHDGPFDFGAQDTTKKIMNLVPVMLQHRLTPPPEETYSLHRKMSGAFLLCAKLKANIQCNHMFDELYSKYKTGAILSN